MTAEGNRHGRLVNPQLELREKPVPVPGAGECLIDVAYCGICGSDFLMAASGPDGTMAYGGLCAPPVTLGHEFSGRVRISRALPSGRAVVVEETYGCLSCEGCRTKGEPGCEFPRKIGFTNDGAFAPSLVVPERKCWSIEAVLRRHGEEAGMRLAALVQPYAIAYSCFRSPGFPHLEAEESVILMGAGPIGLCAVDLARAFGVAEIHVVEPWAERRAIARELGASAVYSRESELPAAFRANWLLDSSGAPAIPAVAERHLALASGKLVYLSKAAAPRERSVPELRGLAVLEPDGHACPDAYPRIIELLAAGDLRGDPLISGVVDLEGALARLRRRLKSPGKILVKP